MSSTFVTFNPDDKHCVVKYCHLLFTGEDMKSQSGRIPCWWPCSQNAAELGFVLKTQVTFAIQHCKAHPGFLFSSLLMFFFDSLAHSLTHSFNKYLRSAYYEPDASLGFSMLFPATVTAGPERRKDGGQCFQFHLRQFLEKKGFQSLEKVLCVLSPGILEKPPLLTLALWETDRGLSSGTTDNERRQSPKAGLGERQNPSKLPRACWRIWRPMVGPEQEGSKASGPISCRPQPSGWVVAWVQVLFPQGYGMARRWLHSRSVRCPWAQKFPICKPLHGAWFDQPNHSISLHLKYCHQIGSVILWMLGDGSAKETLCQTALSAWHLGVEGSHIHCLLFFVLKGMRGARHNGRRSRLQRAMSWSWRHLSKATQWRMALSETTGIPAKQTTKLPAC